MSNGPKCNEQLTQSKRTRFTFPNNEHRITRVNCLAVSSSSSSSFKCILDVLKKINNKNNNFNWKKLGLERPEVTHTQSYTPACTHRPTSVHTRSITWNTPRERGASLISDRRWISSTDQPVLLLLLLLIYSYVNSLQRTLGTTSHCRGCCCCCCC